MSRDLWTGLIFALIGALAFWLGPSPGPAQIDAGHFPRLLSCALGFLGLALIARGLRPGAREAALRFAWRPLLVVVAILAFALLFERAGLIAATLALLLVACTATRGFSFKQVAALCTALVALVIAVFVWGLGLPMELWPWT